MRKLFVVFVLGLGVLTSCRSQSPVEGVLSIDKGGTGAANARDARTNLDVPSLSEANRFTAQQTFEAPVLIRPAGSGASNASSSGVETLLEFHDANGVVTARVDTAGSITGSSAKLGSLESASIVSNSFSGNGAGLTSVQAAALSNLEFGKDFTAGCSLTATNLPDCGTCPSGSCAIQIGGFPATNWMKVGFFTLDESGVIESDIDRSLICDAANFGAIRLDLTAENTSVPGQQTPVTLASTDIVVRGNAGYQRVPQQRLRGRALTQINPEWQVGETYLLYVKATVLEGTPSCFLGRAPLDFVFSPMSGTLIAIPK